MEGTTAQEPTLAAITRVFEHEPPSNGFQPILHVRDIQKMVGKTGDVRYKVMISDTDHVANAIISAPAVSTPQALLDQINSGAVAVHTLIRLTNWTLHPGPKKEILALSDAVICGQASDVQRARPVTKWRGVNGDEMTQMTQPLVPRFVAPAPPPQDYVTTPKKRNPLPEVDGVITPNPPPAPTTDLNRVGGLQNAQSAAWKTAEADLADAPTQDPMQTSGGTSAPAAPPSTSLFNGAIGANGDFPAHHSTSAAIGGPYGGPPSSFGAPLATAAAVSSSSRDFPTAPRDGAQANRSIGDFFSGSSGPSKLPGGGAAVARANPKSEQPIASLSPYSGGRWRIKARVTTKGAIRKFNNQRGEGQLFKVDLVDKLGDEISATFFGKSVDVNFPKLLPNGVFYFSKGSVKQANPRFDRGQHVLTFDEHSVIEAAEEDDPEIGGVKYTFVPLVELQGTSIGTSVDVKGIIAEVREPVNLMTKQNEERSKRELVLWDNSGSTAYGANTGTHIELTLWGEIALKEYAAESVIFLRGVRVGEWREQKSLNTTFNTHIEQAPIGPEAIELTRKWTEAGKPGYMPQSFASTQGLGATQSMSGEQRRKVTVEECQEEDRIKLGPAPVPGQPIDPLGPRSTHWHTIAGTLTGITRDKPPFYAACPEMVESSAHGATQSAGGRPPRACNKKVINEAGSWRCNAGHVCQEPTYRYMCRAQLADHTGSLDFTCFDELGLRIFNCPAATVAGMWEDEAKAEELLQITGSSLFKRVTLKIKTQRDNFREEEQIRATGIDIQEQKEPGKMNEARLRLEAIRAAIGTF